MNRIPTTHVGSLIRPPEVLSFLDKIASGRGYDADAYAECLRTSVSEIVRHQIEVGLDVIDDGEIGKASWITYLYERVSGLEMRTVEREGSVLPPSRTARRFPVPTPRSMRSTRRQLETATSAHPKGTTGPRPRR